MVAASPPRRRGAAAVRRERVFDSSVTEEKSSHAEDDGLTFMQAARVGASAVPDAAVRDFLYQPHYISGLIVLIGYLLYVAFFQPSHTDNSVLRGLAVAALSFVFVGMLMFKSGPFFRPHPLFWRLVLSLSVLYLFVIIFLLFQSLPLARQLVGQIDPSLGRPLAERSYATDCSLTYDNIKDQVLDFFIFAHVAGWWAKTIILRDVWICWILSVMFEVCEYSLQHQMPNFAECWWDHWVLDVLLCNWLGIWMGMRTIRWLAMKTYNWRSIRDIPTVTGKMRRTVAQFTPYSWTVFDWAATRSLRGYVATLLVGGLMLTSEVVGFYLKYLLWIPPPHPLFVLRSVLYAFAGCAAVRETYQYCTDPQCRAIGSQAWVVVAIIVVEVLVIFKWGQGMFPAPFPPAVIVFWCVFSVLLVLFPIWQFGVRPRLFAPPVRRAARVNGAR